MTLQKFQIGTEADGSPRWHYVSDGHVVFTTPGESGERTLADGTTYDVTPDVIEVQTHEHAKELAGVSESDGE